MTGLTGYHAGLAAEDAVARDYLRRGRPVARKRWRGQGGEIDLIVRDGTTLIFVEVKKSSSHARAAHRLSARQMVRLTAAASEYIGSEMAGQLTDVRFDLATVDHAGTVRVLENAFMQA